jgi:CRISPR-associated endonuclease Cas1
MAAKRNLYQVSQSHNSSTSRHGVVTLFGYGIQVRVDHGHLVLEDGIGANRVQRLLPRVGHGLKRLIVIGSDGMVSLAALRWLADQKAAFVMLERNGSVLATTGPVRPSDARLRRAQSLAIQSGTAIEIARELIDKKLAGQEDVARHKLYAIETSDTIHRYRSELAEAEKSEDILLIEAKAASVYWSAWRNLPILFPRKDEPKVPLHWRAFGTRVSPLSGSPRLAVNPPNAMLNYLYAVLESESRLAGSLLGLDPGIGMLHVDSPSRDSLACDLMEVVRPQVDAFLLDWITRESLKREWFFEQRDGNCRLMAQLAIKLSETAPMWGRAVAPFAEWVAAKIWTRTQKPRNSQSLATRLTQRHKREAKGKSAGLPSVAVPRRENLCRGCGKVIEARGINCTDCDVIIATERLADVAKLGRIAARKPESRAKHLASRQRHARASSAWDQSTQPVWLTSDVFSKKIQPLLVGISTSSIRSEIGVSRWYAGKIRRGYTPHERHWMALAAMVGVGGGASN